MTEPEQAVEEDLHRYIAPGRRPRRRAPVHGLGDRDRARSTTPTTSRPGLEERLGEPGEYPFTRGIHDGMYRDRLWTMRQYAGFATAEDTNDRYRYLIEHGSTGLSMAFDLPTQLGRDSDDPLCAGEVGRTGVPIDTIEDMRICFDQIPLDEVSTSMTINAPAAILLLLYELVGEEQGVRVGEAARHGPERRAQGVRGARQLHLPARADDAADHRHLRVLPRERPEVEHDLDLRLPHPREGLLGGPGGRLHALQRDRLRRGRARARASRSTSSRPRLAFFFNCHNNVFQEVAKFRAVRRMWARIMRERFGSDRRALADDPLPHPDRRGDAPGAAARGEHHPRRATGLRRGLRRHPVAAHERLRRGAGAADRALGADRAAHPAGDRARVGRRRDRRPVRRLLLHRVAHRRDRDARPGS